MSKAKKRDSLPLYVPKGMKVRDTSDPETVSGNDLVDGISELSLKTVKSKKTSKKSGTPNGKTLPEVPDSWECISEDDDVTNVLSQNINCQDRHDSSDEEVIQQDARFDYYTMPTNTNDTELAGKGV